MTRTALADKRTSPTGGPVAPGTALWWSDIPIRKKRVFLIELTYNIQSIVDALKLRSKPVFERGPHFYVTREVSADIDRLDRVSDWIARLLRLCDGRRRIKEIVPRLSASLREVQGPLREYVCVQLLAGAQAADLIDIYRSASRTERHRARTGSQRHPAMQAQ